MKSTRKATRWLVIGPDGGAVSVPSSGEDCIPGVPPRTRYVLVGVDDPGDPDRYIGLVLTPRQADALGRRLLTAAAGAREVNVTASVLGDERSEHWRRMAELTAERAALLGADRG